MSKKVFLSSMGFNKFSLEQMIDCCKENGWGLEFSSGLSYIEQAEKIFLKSKINKLAHNYFPAPKTPFVLNLASSNINIRKKSIDHCKKGLQLAYKSKGPFFSAHAGFCIDPNPQMLGKKFELDDLLFDKKTNRELFLESLHELNAYAKSLGLLFLIENNVIIPSNIINGNNPLFCCQSHEIIQILDEFKGQNIGLLLDTGHLKVSAKTLKLDLIDEFKKLRKFITAFHHSDNDASKDTNNQLDEEYWFFDFLNDHKKNIHVIETRCNSLADINRQLYLFSKYGIE
jgi:sugar phosphate isomerase/epimerase